MAIEYRFDKECLRIPDLMRLFQTAADWKMPSDPAEWEELIAHTPLLVSAWDGERLVGFARMLTDFVRWGDIYDVVVDVDMQGHGIGRGLIEGLIQHEKVSRVRTIILGAEEDVHGFYARFGFKRDTGNHFMTLTRKERDHLLTSAADDRFPHP